MFCSTSWIWNWSHVAQTRGTFDAALPMGCLSMPQSCSWMAATWLWTPASLWPSTPRPSSSRPSRHTWSSTSCFTPPAATWETSVWWMLTGCWMQHQSTLAVNSTLPKANQQETGPKSPSESNTGKLAALQSWIWIKFNTKNRTLFVNFCGFSLPPRWKASDVCYEASQLQPPPDLINFLLAAGVSPSWKETIL